MDRSVEVGLYAEALRLSSEGEAERIFDRFEAHLRRRGAVHLLLTGLPLPRRSLSKLILRIHWPDLRNGGLVLDVTAAEPLLALCLAARRPFVVRGGTVDGLGTAPTVSVPASDLLAATGGERGLVVAIPIHDLPPYQGCVLVAGAGLETGPAALAELQFFCTEAFRALIATGRVETARPGDLSDRERHVLRLTAIGKTAAEIAELLEISQRTVHAHLQNAGDKMNASNKTHTVVEALRYGQISL